MGIGINFICKCCHYDTGILMLNQGIHDSVETVIKKYIHSYSQEIDFPMLSQQVDRYQMILESIEANRNQEIVYNYDACVCYGCHRSYELLDVLQKKEEQVYAGEKGQKRPHANLLQDMFHLSEDLWSSLIGEKPQCLFCCQPVIKITERQLENGLACPKCHKGKLEQGNEFEVWG